jgi:hypothetical protein
VLPVGGAGVVPVLGAVVAGGRNGVPEANGPDGGENFEGPAAADRRSRVVGRGVLSPDRDVWGRPGVDGPSVANTAAPRLFGRGAVLLAAAASIRAGNGGGEDRGWD